MGPSGGSTPWEEGGGRSPAASSDPLTTSGPPQEAALPARCVPRELRTGLPPPWDCDGWKCRLMVKSRFPAGLPNWQHLQTGSTFRRQDAGPAMGRGMRPEGDSVSSWAVVPGLSRVTLSHAVPRAALPPRSVPRLLVKAFPGPRSLGLHEGLPPGKGHCSCQPTCMSPAGTHVMYPRPRPQLWHSRDGRGSCFKAASVLHTWRFSIFAPRKAQGLIASTFQG